MHVATQALTSRHRLLAAPLAALALTSGVAAASPARALARPAHPPAALVAAQRTRHVRVYGYLEDAAPATDRRLDVYSRTHKAHYYVYMATQTVVKIRTQTVHRAQLHHGQYVIVTCRRRSDGALEAVTVHIENKHRAPRRHA